MICPYCNSDQPEDRFNWEHVVPQAIGGGLQPTNRFKLRICADCNARCGREIDGPFIKCWQTQKNKSVTAARCLERSPTAFLPLAYVGVLDKVRDGSRICEYWLGPTGDRIYHFHEPYPREANSPIYIGRSLHLPIRGLSSSGLRYSVTGKGRRNSGVDLAYNTLK